MNLKQILYFLQIYRDESFTRAAANLAISQPALSLQINSLEKELGFSLLERSTGKIQVTEKGTTFLTHAVDILDSFHNLENAMQEHELPENLVIAAGGAICGWVLPKVIVELRKENPNLKVHILEGDRNFVRQSLLTGRSDYAILTEELHDPKLESIYFCSDHILPVISTDQEVPKKYSDLKNYPFLAYHTGSSIQRIVEKRLEDINLKNQLNFIMEVRSLNSLLKCVESGIGIGFISGLSLSEKITEVKLDKLYCPRKFYLHYRKKRKTNLSKTAHSMASSALEITSH